MASLNEIIPGFGSGIMHPMTKNRFRVSFLDEQDVKLPYSDSLALQVIRLSSFTQGGGLSQYGLQSAETVLVTLQDDITNYGARAVQELFNLPSGNFKLVIEYLDGNDAIVRTATFGLCRLTQIDHGELDYAGGYSNDQRLRLNIPMREGSLINTLMENPAAMAVMTVLNGASFTITGDSDVTALVETTLSISYDSVKFTFPER
jgi:hypothetical protein